MNNEIQHSTRILGIDPGEKRIGLAISDPTKTIASPLSILEHISREKDARAILSIAEENEVSLIVIGLALDWNGEISFQGKKSIRLVEQIRSITEIPIVLWNEYGSTSTVNDAHRMMGISKKKKPERVDDLAATVILQTYLDDMIANKNQEEG
jgi:putative Holliday junction resolvase